MKIESCIFKTPTRVDPKRAQVNLRAAQIDPEEFESTPNMGSTMTISFSYFSNGQFSTSMASLSLPIAKTHSPANIKHIKSQRIKLGSKRERKLNKIFFCESFTVYHYKGKKKVLSTQNSKSFQAKSSSSFLYPLKLQRRKDKILKEKPFSFFSVHQKV